LNKQGVASCGFCGKTTKNTLHVIRGLRIVQCSRCGYIYTDQSDFFNYNQPSAVLKNRLETYQKYYWPKRRAGAARFWKKARVYYQTGMLLDVGCGFGFFVQEA
jgi:hypothetical protein